jgi:uncharacterized protein YxjI
MRNRREDRRGGDDGGSGGGPSRYQMRDDLLTCGDDFWIEDTHGNKAYKVDGKAVRVRDTLEFEDAHGNVQAKIQSRVARIADTMEVEDAHGKRAALVKKALITPVRERFTVKVADGPDLDIKGNILDHEYKIGDVAEVSKKWFRIRDTYGVEVSPGQDDAIILAVTVVIDQMQKREDEGTNG